MVELFDNLVLEADSRQYTLKRKNGVDENGKDVYTDYKYYSTLKGALNGVVEHTTKKALKENDMTIQELVKTYKEAVEALTKLEDNIVKELTA